MNKYETHTGHCEECNVYTWVKVDSTDRVTCERCHVDEEVAQ